ncbi:hypothetical protein HDU93_007087 [Gonapodya sp. JEL0774]|nr:hypothetical protein HDU93_007087 [Gonapodya sp. JEL0774]
MSSQQPLWRRLLPIGWVLFYIAIVVALNVISIKQGQSELKPKKQCVPNTPCTDANGNDVITTYGNNYADGIVVSAHFVSLDTNAEKISFRLTLDGTGIYANNLNNVTIVAGDTSKTFDLTATSPGVDGTMSSDDGDASAFPFDVHTGTAVVYAFTGLPPATPGRYIPLGFQVVGFTGAYKAEASILDTDKRTGVFSYNVAIKITRGVTTKLFALLVSAIFWGLSLGYGLLTVDIRFKGRKLDLPILAMGPGLLFAMPIVRNATPSIPPIGTQLDMASLFFGMSVVGLCLINNLFRLLWESSAQTDKPAMKSDNYATDMATQGFSPIENEQY